MEQNLTLKNELDRLLEEEVSSVIKREKISFDELVDPFGKSLVLFGGGSLGQKVLARLRQDNIEPLAFTDNNPALWGTDIEGINVLSPFEAAEKYGERAAFIITIWSPQSGHRFKLTKQKLIELNCKQVVSFVPLFWKYSDTFLPDMFMDMPHKIYEHTDAIRETFNLLADNESRMTYLTQLKWRIIANYDGLPERSKQTQYFPEDIFPLSTDEVFIDFGAFDGDTIKIFLSKTESFFARIVAIEPDPINFKRLSMFVQKLPERIKGKISLLQKAVGSHEGKLRFTSSGTDGSKFSRNGNIEVDSVILNNILNNLAPTFIKMDIEGAEFDALLGARDVIVQSKPILAICVYHKQDHLWQIPKLIESFSDQYQLFLRPHDDEGWEDVCYAIPAQRMKN